MGGAGLQGLVNGQHGAHIILRFSIRRHSHTAAHRTWPRIVGRYSQIGTPAKLREQLAQIARAQAHIGFGVGKLLLNGLLGIALQAQHTRRIWHHLHQTQRTSGRHRTGIKARLCRHNRFDQLHIKRMARSLALQQSAYLPISGRLVNQRHQPLRLGTRSSIGLRVKSQRTAPHNGHCGCG